MNDRAKPKRRGFQFRLRTLLIAVLLLALPLSWFAMRMEKAHRQREAVEAIRRMGGVTFFVGEATPPPVGRSVLDMRPYPAWLRKWLGDDFFDEVAGVTFPPQSEGNFSDQYPPPPSYSGPVPREQDVCDDTLSVVTRTSATKVCKHSVSCRT